MAQCLQHLNRITIAFGDSTKSLEQSSHELVFNPSFGGSSSSQVTRHGMPGQRTARGMSSHDLHVCITIDQPHIEISRCSKSSFKIETQYGFRRRYGAQLEGRLDLILNSDAHSSLFLTTAAAGVLSMGRSGWRWVR